MQARRAWRLAPFLHEQIGPWRRPARDPGAVCRTGAAPPPNSSSGMYIRNTRRLASAAARSSEPLPQRRNGPPRSELCYTFDVADIDAELQRRCRDPAVVGLGSVTKPGVNEFALGLGEVSVVGEKFVGRCCVSAISRRRSVKISTFRREPPNSRFRFPRNTRTCVEPSQRPRSMAAQPSCLLRSGGLRRR